MRETELERHVRRLFWAFNDEYLKYVDLHGMDLKPEDVGTLGIRSAGVVITDAILSYPEDERFQIYIDFMDTLKMSISGEDFSGFWDSIDRKLPEGLIK